MTMMRTRACSSAAMAMRAGTWTLGMALALSACGSGAGDGRGGEQEVPPAAEATVVEVARVGMRPIVAGHVGTAPLEAHAESQVVAKTSGVALQVLAEEGQQVRAGQVLVRLDPDRARLQVAQSAAQMRKLEASYRRSMRLAEQKLISANDFEQLKYDLENARAGNDMARLELSYAQVRAPISGVIASSEIKAGNFVQINTPIFRIVDDSRLEAVLKVPERHLATIRVGQPVSLQADALPGRHFSGTVVRVSPVVDAGSGTFRVVSGFAGGNGLQAGMFGRLRIEYERRADALTVPRAALLDDDDGDPAVYVVRNGKAVRVSIEPGHVDGQWVEVRKGLKAGESVVTAGGIALRDGSPVQVIGNRGGVAAKTAGSAGGKARR